MGYYTDGVTYFWFDDNQNFGGADPHVPGTPQNLAEFSTAFPLVCGQPNFGGVLTKAGLVWFILQNTVIGGKAGVDPFNDTTWTELTSKYIFLAPGKTLTIRTQGAVPNVFLNHGIKIGTGKRISGARGVNWYQAANIVIQQNANLYGGKYESDGSVQISDAAANNEIEAAGCEFQGNSGVMGVQGTGVKLYNNLFGLGTTVTSLSPKDSDNVVLAISGSPASFFQSASALKKPKGLSLIGSPTQAQIRAIGGAPAWRPSRIKWADSSVAHIELASANIDPNGGLAVYESEEFHFRVMDRFGNPLSNVPAQIVSDGQDYGGLYDPWGGSPLYSNIEGDYVWTDFLNTGDDNTLVARSWGTSGGVQIFRDRTFTISVNLRSMPGYQESHPSRVKSFTVPGRDMRNGSPVALGGDFYTIVTVPIVLSFGGIPGEWEKCEV